MTTEIESENAVRSEPGKIVAVFDLDGTLTRYDTYLRYLIGFLLRNPCRVFRTALLPFDVIAHKIGARDNTWLKKRFLSAILSGLTDEDLHAWTHSFVDTLVARGLRPGALERLRQHQLAGDRTILLSASPDIFVREIADRLGFSECECTIAERDQAGRLTGNLAGGNCYGPEKQRRMERLLGNGRAGVHVVAYGDHRSDLPLLRWADEGILVNPSQALGRVARQFQLKTVHW